MPADRRHHRPLPAAQPSRTIFDPWNSSATGHQRAENRLAGSTGWRDSRTNKLAYQFRGGRGGGRRIADAVGGGIQEPERIPGWQSVGEMLNAKEVKGDVRTTVTVQTVLRGEGLGTNVASEEDKKPKGKLFDGLSFYINGSTAPTISDHRLKYLIAEHGGRIDVALGRRKVTHVIVGAPTSASNGAKGTGAGGGLAAAKLQKEIKRAGGCGVKYVDVRWVTESIEAGKRLPEARFANMSTAPTGQKSVYGMFRKQRSTMMESTIEASGAG
ncbi:MAG: hypothetical protein M1817_000649 [Caeruleum heppii]|nr:MAG: hypothetical protein M1817_000649 [Caeruleum heppii]